MRVVGALLLALGVGLLVFEVVAHDARDRLVLYFSAGFDIAGLALLGYADEIASGVRPLVEAVSGVLPWGRRGE